MPVERLYSHVETYSTQRSHVENAPYIGTTAHRAAFARLLSGVTVHRSNSNELGLLTRGQIAKSADSDRAKTLHGLHDFDLAPVLFFRFNAFCQTQVTSGYSLGFLYLPFAEVDFSLARSIRVPVGDVRQVP